MAQLGLKCLVKFGKALIIRHFFSILSRIADFFRPNDFYSVGFRRCLILRFQSRFNGIVEWTNEWVEKRS